MIFYGPKEAPGVKELGQKSPEPSTRVEGTPYPLGRAPCLMDDSETPPGVRPTPKIPINTETPRKKPRSGVSPVQASVGMKNLSRHRSGTLPEGETITDGHLYHLDALLGEEGVVHPRG